MNNGQHRGVRNRSLWGIAVLAVAALGLAACSSGISDEEAAAKDTQISQLQNQVQGLTQDLASIGKDARYWQQLTNVVQPVQMTSMTDHRAFMLPTGGVLAVHHDNLDLSKAENLNWLAFGVPGRFCKQDQERVQAQFGPGFSHFHDMVNDTHGGAVGAEGVWFVHIAVRNFDSAMSGGPVTSGIDSRFMPTPARECT